MITCETIETVDENTKAFYDAVISSGVSRLVITVFDGNNVTNTIIPAWRFEALNPFLSHYKTLRIIDTYVDSESNETSLWAILVVDNETDRYKEWLNNMYGMKSRKEKE